MFEKVYDGKHGFSMHMHICIGHKKTTENYRVRSTKGPKQTKRHYSIDAA